MEKFSFKINLSASSKDEATTKMKGLVTLAENLSAKELSRLADIIKNDPVKTALAKKYMGV